MTTPYPPHDDDDMIEDALWRLERAEARHHEQYRRLRNVEGHMDLLMRRNDPARFGAWLRHADVTSPPGKALRGLMERDLLRYIGWLQRVHDAYVQTPPLSVFEEALDEEEP
jgi:hypothetical protein